MNAYSAPDAYGVLIEPATLKIQRLLPGPIERVWAYLTESEERRKWLAAGEMEMRVGAPFEFVWRNDELSCPVGKRPEGFGEDEGQVGGEIAVPAVAGTLEGERHVRRPEPGGRPLELGAQRITHSVAFLAGLALGSGFGAAVSDFSGLDSALGADSSAALRGPLPSLP